MSLTQTAPPPSDPPQPETPGTPRWIPIALIAAFALVGYALYANHMDHQEMSSHFAQDDQRAQALTAQLDKTNSRLADLKGELEVTSQKLGLTQDELARARALAQTIRKEQKEGDEQLHAQIGQVQQEATTKIGEVSTELNGTKTDVEATKKDLDATKGKLERSIGDLGVASGLIAKNHDDVEQLKRLGERNIYEFSLEKGKTAQHVGPIQVELRKVDPKKFRFTLNVIADDKTIEKRDKTVGEPVQFYVKGTHAPLEIVVFDLGKNKASGYLSTPKDFQAGNAPSR